MGAEIIRKALIKKLPLDVDQCKVDKRRMTCNYGLLTLPLNQFCITHLLNFN